jgi:hypothetical protein
MQLEIKIVIDFGDDGPPPDSMNSILKFAVEELQDQVLEPVCEQYGARATTNTGWTSSGDDEEEEHVPFSPAN